MEHDSNNFKLPLSIVSVVDLGRLIRELEGINDFLLQASVRKKGASMVLPKTTHILESLAQENNLNLLNTEDRKMMNSMLRNVKNRAPVIHLSFAVDPSAAFLQKILAWFRENIHPQMILQVGLQPNIAAGCIVRTTNKYFDFSLRKHLDNSRKLLLDELSKKDLA